MRLLIPAVAAALSLVAPTSLGAAAPDSDPPLALDYDGSVVLKVLDLRIEQRLRKGGFAADARIRSHGILSVFKKVDVRAVSQGEIQGEDLLPASFQHENLDGVANRKVRVRWAGDDVTTSAAPAYPSLGDPAPTRAQKLAAADPLTQLMRMSLADSEAGPCNATTRMFDGRQLYEVTLGPARVRPPTPVERRFGLSRPIECTLVFSEVAGFDPKPKRSRTQGLKMPLTIAFAQTNGSTAWVVSSLRGGTPLGEAKIELRSVTGLSGQP